MFTGIIEALGKITALEKVSGDVRLCIHSSGLDFSDVKLGDSIASSGICLTVTQLGEQCFWADVSNETLKSSSLAYKQIGDTLHLEKAMAANGRFGGHIVTGHVDAVGEVRSVKPEGRSLLIDISVPSNIQQYIARKGSITVDGVSLTSNALTEGGFLLSIVPHTLENCNLGDYKSGSQVNIEVDVIARYLEQLVKPQTAAKSTMDKSFLAQHGFYK